LNAYSHGYGRNAAPLRDPRGTEYDAFIRVTRALSAAGAQRETAFAAYAQALHDNQRLWQILAVDLARPENALPPALKTQLFQLFKFTVQHTAKALRSEVELDVLIDINTAVMRGLRGEGA